MIAIFGQITGFDYNFEISLLDVCMTSTEELFVVRYRKPSILNAGFQGRLSSLGILVLYNISNFSLSFSLTL